MPTGDLLKRVYQPSEEESVGREMALGNLGKHASAGWYLWYARE